MSEKRGSSHLSPSSKNHLASPSPALKIPKTLSYGSLSKESASIISILSIKIEESENRIANKIDTEISAIRSTIDNINTRLLLLESGLNDISTLKAENSELKQQILQHNEAISSIRSHMELRDEQQRLKETMSDAVLHEVPPLPGENLNILYFNLCTLLDVQPPKLKSIFRLKSKSNTSAPPIILKFFAPHDKSLLLRSIAEYRKTNKQQLRLHDLGLNECINKPYTYMSL